MVIFNAPLCVLLFNFMGLKIMINGFLAILFCVGFMYSLYLIAAKIVKNNFSEVGYES